MSCSGSNPPQDREELNAFSPLPTVRSEQSRRYRPNRLPTIPEERSLSRGRFPSWLHRRVPKAADFYKTDGEIASRRLHTVCEEASCPNILECYSKKTATFLLLGRLCTRACGFCDIEHAALPGLVDQEEPFRVAESAAALGLKHVVLTMVARDDLLDGGAQHVAETIEAIRETIPDATCEVLISDLMGRHASLDTVLEIAPEIFNHNLETVERLSPRVRSKATYERSLAVLKYAKKYIQRLRSSGILTKSGLMLGLGESREEVYQALRDLHAANVDIVTLGQYLQPNQKKLPVREFIHPDQFEEYKTYGLALGIPTLYSGPFVRSSYNAALFVQHRGSGKITEIEST